MRDDARSGALSAVGFGALGVLWYALPDYVPSRQRRARLKAGIAGVIFGWSLLTGPPLSFGDGEEASPPTWWDRSGLVARAGAVAGAVGAALAVTVSAERWIYRLGERSARRGTAYPHTRIGVVMGALSVLTQLGVALALRHVEAGWDEGRGRRTVGGG